MEAIRRPAGSWYLQGRVAGMLDSVRQSTHAAVASEIMVEGPIFLDENDDVLDVSQFGANGWSGTGGSTSSAATRQKHSRELSCSRGGANFQ